jgi:tetratricopeptide (TPR) repeat protein
MNPGTRRVLGLTAGALFCGALLARSPAVAWEWNDQESSVLPSLQAEFDQELTAYRAQVEKGLGMQERIIGLDRLISQYKPQGINTVVLESERDRLTVQMDKDRQTSQSSQQVASELYQLAGAKVKEGRFQDALAAIQKAERLVPDDSAVVEMRHKLAGVVGILPNSIQADKSADLVRRGVSRYIENDGTRSLNALRYASQLRPDAPALSRLVLLVEKDYPDATRPSIGRGKSLVDYKLQLSLEYVYDGQYLKAINECNQVLDLEPDNVLALTRLGSAHYAMGQKQEAKVYWARALKLEPNNQVLKDFLKDKF